MIQNPSYYALRRGRGAAPSQWWAARRGELPEALMPLAHGRTRVELDRGQAIEALIWAEATAGAGALQVYPEDPRD